ncbi:hypothetical protein [Brevundimonas sp.]|uniref:hypothetical protein n=1 Tax=Brevundimonas sp. TaxID=1871086 RepID=UPI003D6D4E81
MMRALTILSAGGLLSTAALLAVINAKNVEERGLRTSIAGHEACDRALDQQDPSVSAKACPAPVAAVHRRAVQAATCDQALTNGDLFALRSACSTPVKTLTAQRDAARTERDDANAALDQLRADQAGAIARAEARGRTQTQRIQSAQNDLASAPRNDAGLGRCDADCLRDLGRSD